jgi:hypothetical protein
VADGADGVAWTGDAQPVTWNAGLAGNSSSSRPHLIRGVKVVSVWQAAGARGHRG